MKYHYFHGRFTYSVKRSWSRRVRGFYGHGPRRRLDSCVASLCGGCVRGRVSKPGRPLPTIP